ncbi:MAG: methyltransferase domain-containing protein [Gammaproteobacteria bacterium]
MPPEDWAGEMGERWNRHIDVFESMITPVGEAAIEFAAFRPGESVVDIGCGGGPSAFRIAEQVGDDGHVTGIDVSPRLIATARARQTQIGATNIDFIVGDAATMTFERTYDCLFSRFGVMFFEDPYAAFKNLATAITPGGRAAICCWGPPPANPWVGDLMAIIARHIELPQRDPRAPGPFAFGDREYLGDILDQAGFRDVEFTIWKGDQYLGGIGADARAATEFALDATFIGDLLADASEETRRNVTRDLVSLLQNKQTEQGIAMKGTAWLVAARVE